MPTKCNSFKLCSAKRQRHLPSQHASPSLQHVTLSSFAAHGGNGISHLGTLLQAPLVCTKTLFGKLQGALEGCGRADLDELEQAALVWCEACDLTDDLLHQDIAGALVTFTVRWPH